MGKSQRDKGARGERELAAVLTSLGFPSRRTCQTDGRIEADVIGMDGLHIECKRTESFRLWEALEQSKRDADEGEIPVVMHRPNRKPWIVVIELRDFAEIWRHAHMLEDER